MATYSTSASIVTQSSTITSTANRSYTISADLNDNDANIVGGSAERVVPMALEVGNGDFRPVEYNLVNGSGIRVSNSLETSLNTNSSVVSGEAENIQTGSGVLVTGSSIVAGVAENKITASGSLTANESTVSGSSIRTVVEIEADLTAEEVGVVAITGESERIIVGSGSPSSDSSSVSGVSERTSNGTGTIQSQSSTVSIATSISAKGQGTLVSQNSTVTGVSENVITGTGTLTSGVSSVSGVAERQIDGSGSGSSQDGPSDVIGVAERKVTATGSIVVEATLFPATGFSERTINGSVTASAQSSTVSGEGERIVENNTIVLQAISGSSGVSGASVRRSNGAGVLSSQVSIVSGDSEREITGAGSIETVTDSIVSGTAENVNSGAGVLSTSSSSISGVAERTIKGSGTLDTVTDSTVAGVAENQIDYVSGVEQVDPSTVSGVAERTIVASGDLDTVSNSVISAGAERVNPASGVLTSGESDVVATTERTINRLPDINGYPNDAGDTSFGPDDTDSKVDYVSRPQSYSPRYLELNSTSNVNRDGVYDVLISGFTVAESGLSYVPAATTTYNVYYKERGANYDVVVYNTTRSAWYLTTISDIDQFFAGGIPNATVSQESLVSTNSSVPYGIEYDPIAAEPSEVVGVAERIVVDVTTDLQAPDNIVNGVAERGVDADNIQIELTDDYSDVTAITNIGRITSPELASDFSVVAGISERTITASGIEQVQESTVSGIAERIVTLESGIEMPDEDSKVVGLSERTITASATLVDSSSTVAGVAENIVTGSGTLDTITESLVSGVAERTITASATLVDSSSTVAGVAENIVTGSGTLDTITESLVSGVAERILTVTGIDMPDDDSKVTGVAERRIGKPFFADPIQGVPSRVVGLAERTVENNNITLQVISQESTVAGVAERTVNLFSGVEQSQESIVSGLAERIVTGEGELNTVTDSIVVGVAERIIDDQGGDALVTTPALVNSVAERIVTVDEGVEQTQESVVSGIAERILETNELSQDLVTTESIVIGIAERTMNASGTLDTITDSIVAGVAEREIDDQGGDALVTTPSLVAGIAERTIETNEISQDLVTTESIVVGVAERTIETNEISQDLVTTPSVVVGIAERTIETNEISQDLVTTPSVVVGIAERVLEINEINQSLKPTENNIVSGVAERIIVIQSSADVQGENVDVVTNNGDPITIDRHPIGGNVYPQYRSDLYAGDAQPILDADRVITQQPDGLSDTYRYAPNVSDPDVTYTGFNNELLVLSGIDPNYDNVYQMLPEGYTISTSAGTDYVLSRDDDYITYYWRNRSAGYNEYRIVAYRTNNETWAVFETTLNPELFFYDGLVISGSVASSLTVANSRQSKRGPYKDLRPTEYNLVTGDGDRVHENYETPSYLVTEDCVVTAVVEITSNGLDVTPKASPSVVTGTAERISEDNGATHNLQGSPSVVTCNAERALSGTGTLVAATSRVSGIAEREVVRVVDGRGPLAYSPREEDANVVYHNGSEVTIKGLTAFDVQYNGVYNLLGVLTPTLSGFRVVESGNDYTLVHDANYNVYYARVQPDYAYTAPHWHIIVFNTTRNAWYATETTIDPRTFDDGITIAEAAVDHAHIDDFSELRSGPYASQQGDNSEVDAVVERTSNGNGEIASGYSSVNAVTEISSNLLESNVQADASEVDATVIRTVVSEEASIQSDSSQVFATDDRVIVSIPGKSNVKATNSTVTSATEISRFATGDVSSESSNISGIAERTSNGTGKLETQDHVVEGVSERKITAVGTLVATTAVTETVVGVAERTVVNVAPTNVHSEDCVVDGFAFRKITSLQANLVSDSSTVRATVYNNIPDQDAMHTQRVFRIRKEPVRTIIVRQTPTRNAR